MIKSTPMMISAGELSNDIENPSPAFDNLTDETVIVSRRPFGARPGKPRQATMGIKFTF
jgi:hypothetical protein